MINRRAMAVGTALIVAGALTLKVCLRSPKREAARGAASSYATLDGGADGPMSGSMSERPDGPVSAGPPGMLHLDPHRTNRSAFVGPSTPNVVWTFDTGGPVEAAPVVLADGTILVASLGGKLYGLDDRGVQRFTVDLEDRVYATPLVHDDMIFVGSDAHRFFGLSRDGTVRFRLETEGEVDTAATPTPWGGIVFASGKIVYATRSDGTLLWRIQARRKCYSSPAIGDDGTVYFGSQDHNLYAVSPAGKLMWRLDLGADVDSTPAIADDGTILVGTDKSEVVAINFGRPDTGPDAQETLRPEVRWRRDVGGYVRGALSIGRDGAILVGTYGPTPRLVALEPDDGRVRFRFSIRGTGAPEFGIHGGPVEDAERRLYFGAQDDHVYALSRDGTLLWKFKTGGDVDAPLVITPRGLLLVGSDDGKLYALGSP